MASIIVVMLVVGGGTSLIKQAGGAHNVPALYRDL